MAVIALDVGGSSVKHGLVDLNQPLVFGVHTSPINSQGSAGEIIDALAAIIRQHLTPDAQAVGFSFPGPFDYANGVSYITGLTKFESLYGRNVGDMLRHALHMPDLQTRFRNDAEAAVVGEALYGAGAGHARIIGVTLGTGFGSAFLANGQSLTHGNGVPENGWLYSFPFEGVRADDVFSTRGLLRRFEDAGLHFHNVGDADPSNERVQQVYTEFGRDLGQFLQPFAERFHADCILVLGGIAGAYTAFQAALQQHLAPVQVMKGKLEERAALLGAATLFI